MTRGVSRIFIFSEVDSILRGNIFSSGAYAPYAPRLDTPLYITYFLHSKCSIKYAPKQFSFQYAAIFLKLEVLFFNKNTYMMKIRSRYKKRFSKSIFFWKKQGFTPLTPPPPFFVLQINRNWKVR